MARNAKKQIDLDAPLSPEARKWVDDAGTEFAAKQEAIESDWKLSSSTTWAYDPENGLLTFDFPGGRSLLADGQLLGTFSVPGSSFEWAWNSPHFDAAITRDSKKLKALGKQYEMAYLLEGMIPVPEAFLDYLSAIAVKASDSSGVFRGTTGDIHPFILLKNVRWA